MKIQKFIILISFFCAFVNLNYSMEMQKLEIPATFEALPTEIKKIIIENLIGEANTPAGAQRSVKNITNLAETNKAFNQFINNPDNLIAIIRILASKFKFADELYFAKALRNMRGTKSEKFQQWISALSSLNIAVKNRKWKKVKELIQQGVTDKTILVKFVSNLDEAQSREPLSPGELGLVKFFMDNGADINETDEFGSTALLIAVTLGYAPLVERILQYKPNITIADQYGKTAIDYAAQYDRKDIMNLLKNYIAKNKISLSATLKKVIDDYEKRR